MLRVRRARTPDVVESTPNRVRRVRPVEAPESADKGRITRVRRAPVPVPEIREGTRVSRRSRAVIPGDSRPYFVIDWERGLGWKLQIYLVMSLMYYVLHRTIISDHDYDRLCFELLEGWDSFEHPHKHCVDKGQLHAGTGYAIKYPTIVYGAAEHMLKNFREI